MKHLKLTFVGLLALTAAASDAHSARAHRVPRRVARRWVARRWVARQWEARQWEACRRWVAAYRVCRAVAHPVSQVARWAAAYPVSRAVDPSAMSRQAPREMPWGMSR